MPKISVIVPVYNVEKYVVKCLNSVYIQTYHDFEVVIVDDGSTDNSLDIVRKYQKSHKSNTLLISQENGGLGAARNTGVLNSTGEYLLFLDSDDTIEPNALQTLYDLAIKKDADMAIFDMSLVTEDGQQLKIGSGYKEKRDDFTLNEAPDLLVQTPSACNKMFRKSLFSDNEITFPSRVWYEDLHTIPKLFAYANKVTYIKMPLYNYLLRGGSIMHNSNIGRVAEIIDAVDDVMCYYQEHDLYDSYMQELEFIAVYHLLISASVRVIKSDRKNPILLTLHEYVSTKFPHYCKNKYLSLLSHKEKVILALTGRKMYRTLKFILKLNDLLKTYFK